MDALKLAAVMKEKSVSISELADKANVEKSTISRILSGQVTSCTVDTAGKIINALSLDMPTANSIFFEDRVA